MVYSRQALCQSAVAVALIVDSQPPTENRIPGEVPVKCILFRAAYKSDEIILSSRPGD